MGLISSIVMGVAGGIFRAGRSAYQDAAAQKAADDNATTGAVNAARAQSAQDARRLGAKGAPGAHASFAQMYKAQIAKAVDTDHDGVISREELTRQVKADGGSAEHADALYKALDTNGDGKVSVAEFKDGLPVPNTAVAQQVLQMLHATHQAQTPKA